MQSQTYKEAVNGVLLLADILAMLTVMTNINMTMMTMMLIITSTVITILTLVLTILKEVMIVLFDPFKQTLLTCAQGSSALVSSMM